MADTKDVPAPPCGEPVQTTTLRLATPLPAPPGPLALVVFRDGNGREVARRKGCATTDAKALAVPGDVPAAAVCDLTFANGACIYGAAIAKE